VSDLPTGTITFLFTDIEGSTRLWDEQPERMRDALARHDALLHEILTRFGGYVFKTIGDAFCAAFSRVSDAVAAAVAGQQVLTSSGGDSFPLPVRMAIHCGTAEERGGDYFGPVVNRTARLLAIGHGGQVLLSAAAQELVRDELPAGVSLRELGQHGLRDLQRPEQVFQLCHPDLRNGFPPLRSLNTLLHNLPQQVNRFVGRERELAEVQHLLREGTRLLTITGPGGTGKTRLALQIAAELLDTQPDGVWFVELASLTDTQMVPQAALAALGLREEAGRAPLQSLLEHVSGKHLLLILDNCEHLLDACAELAGRLLRSCRSVTILATSREALNTAGETIYPLAPFAVPDPRRLEEIEALGQYEAVRLFLDRAVAAVPSFRLDKQNAPAVAEVCYHLDGIPLALELAAARLRVLSVERLAERLQDRFRLLTGGSRTELPHHQTLRALFDWSHDLLSPAERAFLRRLSVFSGGWTLEAAEAICVDPQLPEQDVLDLLTSLVEKSLVLRDPSGDRYTVLETVRQYAREKLGAAGEAQQFLAAHAHYFLYALEHREERPFRIDVEMDNLRAALDGCIQRGDAGTGLRLAAALIDFWMTRGSLREGQAWMERLLQVPGGENERLRARVLVGAATLAGMQEDVGAARRLAAEGLALARSLGDPSLIARALRPVGYRALRDFDFAAARSCFSEGLELFRQLNQPLYVAERLSDLGHVERLSGNTAVARACYEESIRLFREIGRPDRCATPLTDLGHIAHREGQHREALDCLSEALTQFSRMKSPWAVASVCAVLASIAHSQGQLVRAARLFGAAAGLRAAVGAPLPEVDRRQFETDLEAVRNFLDPATFDAAWAEGHAMTFEQVVTYASAGE
jgi:predicted ATPase/class 3 adenylate cyclase